MKPRRIPARAEKVYTYNLSRNPGNDRKLINGSETPVTRFDNKRDDRASETKVNYEYAKKNDPKDKVKATSHERANQKKNDREIFAWGDSEPESDSFYDTMQEHEVGDPDHEEKPEGLGHKTHSGEIPEVAKQNYLNVPEEKLPTGTTETSPEKDKPASTGFLNGDQKSNEAEPLA